MNLCRTTVRTLYKTRSLLYIVYFRREHLDGSSVPTYAFVDYFSIERMLHILDSEMVFRRSEPSNDSLSFAYQKMLYDILYTCAISHAECSV